MKNAEPRFGYGLKEYPYGKSAPILALLYSDKEYEYPNIELDKPQMCNYVFGNIAALCGMSRHTMAKRCGFSASVILSERYRESGKPIALSVFYRIAELAEFYNVPEYHLGELSRYIRYTWQEARYFIAMFTSFHNHHMLASQIHRLEPVSVRGERLSDYV